MSLAHNGHYTLDSESIGVGLFFNIGTLFSPTPPPVAISRPPRTMEGKNCLAWLANRSLAWSILNLDETFCALHAAEAALIRAYAEKNFKLARSGLQADLNKARKRDCDNLLSRLDKLIANSEANIICILQNNEGGRPYQLKELATAFTKRIRTPMAEEAGVPDISPFLRKSVAGLQRIANRPPDFEIPSWAITSIDVDFPIDDARLIGRGAFGRVVEGEWNGKVVAVKELRSSNNEAVAVDSIRREVQPFIVSEYCSSGNALRYIKRNPQVDFLKLLYGIASGMAYLHDQGVIHGDLKASNILISDNGEALIADFGLSQIQDQVSSSMNITRTSADRVGGTARWMAPELLLGKGLNKPADVYSFALTAWELYTKGSIPYGNVLSARQLSVLVQRGERPERPLKMDDGVWKLTQKCWRLEPTERPHFVEIEWTLGVLMSRKASGDVSFISRVTRGRVPPPPLNTVTNLAANHQEGEVNLAASYSLPN
ncbi:hypothetical protein H0H92_007247 [Tricholoma furcatifolium]|nr:hypothetical protein H0H92_007247 [Tricholoma furcatifolium]